MLLSLDLGTVPKGLNVKIFPHMLSDIGNKVMLGDYEITFEDFSYVVKYFLTNTDLRGPDDPRYDLVEKIKRLSIVKSRNPGGLRFGCYDEN